MIINDIQARKFLLSLYSVAEKDANDVIANAASALAVRLEVPKKEYNVSDLEARIIGYANSNYTVDLGDKKSRRKTYKRRVSLA